MSRKKPADGGVDLSYLSDKKLEKGKKKLLQEDVKEWKGPSAKKEREQREESKRIQKKVQARSVEKVSWKKRAGGACAILFLCGVGFANFLSAIWPLIVGSGIKVLDIKDTAKLKEVLFGGDPWLVYCVNNVTQSQRLPKVLEEGASSLKSNIGLRLGVLSCWEQTESGRSVAQRFKLKSSPPLAFVVANGNKPRVLNMVGVSKPEDIEKKVLPALKLDIHRIDSLKKWPKLCTSRRACIIVGHKNVAQRDTAVNLLRPLHEKHRVLNIVTLDTSFWRLKLDDGILKSRPSDKGKSADVLCLVRHDGGKDGNSTHSGSFLQSLTKNTASEFMQACEDRKDLVKVNVPPRISAKPSKPKTVTVPPTTPRPKKAPAPAPKPKQRESRSNVDHVGSRETLEREEEALFEAVEEEEAAADSGSDASSDEDGTEEDAEDSSAEEDEGQASSEEDEVEL
mmetsp:Transcript_129770/g.225514  ORF Transcript_129770/g.225514 Transcript_129770/m.225514 type:complete len:453 (+) Transcript_129770:130-1488(+)